MGTTPIYGIPYPAAGDSPNGPAQMQALANEVETELARIDAAIASINGLDIATSASSSDENFTSSTYIPGTVAVGVAFTAPPSGKVLVHFGGYLANDINGSATILSFEMKTGGTVGSGTLVGSAANSDRAILCGKAVNASAAALLNASSYATYIGLTPGTTYNVRTMHASDPGTSSHCLFRQIAVIPML